MSWISRVEMSFEKRRDPLELRVGVLVAAEDPLEVEDGEAAELSDQTGRLGGDDAVERRGEQRKLKPVRTERPRHVDIVGIAGPARGDDRDVIKPVGPAGLLSTPDLYFHCGIIRAPRTTAGVGRSGARSDRR